MHHLWYSTLRWQRNDWHSVLEMTGIPDRLLQIIWSIYMFVPSPCNTTLVSFSTINTQQTWSGFSRTTVPNNNRQSGLSPTMVPEMSTGYASMIERPPVMDTPVISRKNKLLLDVCTEMFHINIFAVRNKLNVI